MILFTKIMILTKFHEGVKYQSYFDSKGLLTWGIGWCLQTKMATEYEGNMISKMVGIGLMDIPFEYPVAMGRWLDAQSQIHKIEIAHFMHSNTINELIPQVETRLGYWPDMNDNQQAAIVDICYNMGIDRWIGLFPETNILLAQGKYEEASIELLDSDYHRDLVELRPNPSFVLRSERISRMIATGEWPTDTDFKNQCGPEPKDLA